jgi:hypothetical protein
VAKPLGDFENKSRLLSDDEKELIGVLKSFYDAIGELRAKVEALEAEVAGLRASIGVNILTQKKSH